MQKRVKKKRKSIKSILLIIFVIITALFIFLNAGRPKFVDLEKTNLGELAELKSEESAYSSESSSDNLGSCDDYFGSGGENCKEKTCESVYGVSYNPCPEKSSNDYAKCCGSNEKCCYKNKKALPVCCSNEKKGAKDMFSCESLSKEINGEKIEINYCKVKECKDPKPQKCSTFWASICCKAKPEEYCGKQTEGFDTPFCAKKIEDDKTCPKGYFECYRQKLWFRDDMVLCCIEGKETCDSSPFGNKKFCNSQKCDSGKLCVGKNMGTSNDYSWRKICCEENEVCFHHPNGYPKCVQVKTN